MGSAAERTDRVLLVNAARNSAGAEQPPHIVDQDAKAL